MKELSLDYIAGFFDGEGCVAISAKKGIRVILTNTNLPILQTIRAQLGGVGKIRQKKRYAADVHRKPCYHWVCWSSHADHVLRIIAPHLVLKSAEAALAMQYRSTTTKLGVELGDSGNRPLPENVVALREELALEARRLKCA